MTIVEKSPATSPRVWQISWSAVRAARRLGKTHAFRLAILYLAVFAASVLGVLLFIYWMSADFIERQTEATLDAEITGLAEQYAQRGISGLVQIVAARSAGNRGDSMLYLVTTADGRPLAGNVTNWPKGVAVRSGPLSFTTEVNVKGQTETHPARGMLIVIPEGYRLLVARDISDATAFRGHIKTTLIWSGLMALAVGLVGGAVMGRNMLRRVEQVNRTAERVVGGNLSDRVPLRGSGDEFDQLANNLNGMLDQIERLMTGIREVTDNVAHDLKTPLARLRARLELALLPDADAVQQSAAIRAAIEEADRMLATFNALLSIAEAEARAGREHSEPLDLGEIARAVAELYEPLAEERGFAFALDVEAGLIIQGDRNLLSQAIANLLDNALKYGGSPRGSSEIRLSARRDQGMAVLDVCDRGPGIPEMNREAVFDRFVRLEPSRSTPGNGLGLSLVRAIVHLHSGVVQLGDNKPGLRVRLKFPTYSG
jgi:signal transduction histidine kinase